MNYTHFTTSERICIADYVDKGFSLRRIAKLIYRDVSAVSREIKRNSCKAAYNPAVAASLYERRKQRCGAKPKIVVGNDLYNRIVSGLIKDWSPDQIVHTVANDVSISTVYRAAHKNILRRFTAHFRFLTYKCGWKKGRKRGSPYKDAKTIYERPKSAHTEFGHWELDSMAFCRREAKSVAVFVEKSQGYVITVLLDDKKATGMRNAILATFSQLPLKARKTLTVDRGPEFELWKEIEAKLAGTEIYFCDPMRPQQKGLVESIIGLLRQYYPKHKATIAPSPQELAAVQASLNSRPRKKHNYATPCQKFYSELNMCCT